jgi:non-heme chloroperoxidase
VFDGIRTGVAADRSQFYYDLSEAFYGFHRPGTTVSEGKRREFWSQDMAARLPAALDCVKQFSETDFTAEAAGDRHPGVGRAR